MKNYFHLFSRCTTGCKGGTIAFNLMVIIFAAVSASSPNHRDIPNAAVTSVYSEPSGQSFNHLVVDKNTGRVFVGAVNRLLQLTPDLVQMAIVETGPLLDSPECSYFGCHLKVLRKPTDNVNKALVVDYGSSRLIVCGSIFQGVCSARSLHNVSDVREVPDPMVANDATSSTVAFVAPGPSKVSKAHVLYVGVTYTGNSPYRSEVPAVSSRSLEDSRLFQVAQSSFTTGTWMSVNLLLRERYLINYVYGFSSEGFSYFLTTQLKEDNYYSYAERITWTYHSKLVRVCQDDDYYYSYAEIPIECTGNNYGYNLVQAAYVGKAGSILATKLGITVQDDVLFATFSQSESIHTDTPSDASALCVYSLKAIKSKFLMNIRKCFNGQGARGLNFISPSQPCVAIRLSTINEDFCGHDVNTPFGGDQPVATVPALLFDTQLTAVASSSTGDFTVVFIGTVQGHLKKVVVDSPTSAFEYEDVPVDEGSPVNKDLHFDTKSEHLYVMTEKKISKVKVHDCTEYADCLSCLGGKDPFCGWCSLEDKCSSFSNCRDAAKHHLNWMSQNKGRCIIITYVTPYWLQWPISRTLELTIDDLSDVTGDFYCSFTILDKVLITGAVRENHSIKCPTPKAEVLPSIPTGHHNLTAKLSVQVASWPNFIATNFTFFDCSTYRSCSECVSSFPCYWCIHSHKCTHDTFESCRKDTIISGISQTDPYFRTGPTFCPIIEATIEGSSEILVPSDEEKAVEVKVHIEDPFIVQTQFLCQFNIEGLITSVNAQLISDIIYCDPMKFATNESNVTATLKVIWGGFKLLDNPNNVHILIYSCKKMADDCRTCLALPKKFGCGWCRYQKYCSLDDQCSNIWVNHDQYCPNNEIKASTTKSTPIKWWQSKSNITFEKINFGWNFSDIHGNICWQHR